MVENIKSYLKLHILQKKWLRVRYSNKSEYILFIIISHFKQSSFRLYGSRCHRETGICCLWPLHTAHAVLGTFLKWVGMVKRLPEALDGMGDTEDTCPASLSAASPSVSASIICACSAHPPPGGVAAVRGPGKAGAARPCEQNPKEKRPFTLRNCKLG